MSSSSLDNLTPIDLSTLSADSITSQTSLNGIITIKWPYSTSAKKLTFLLADPDPRKRARGGQVKVSLLGKAAEEVDKIESGENIAIALPPNESNEATFEIESVSDTPRVKWHITFPHGCILFVFLLLPPFHLLDSLHGLMLGCRLKILQDNPSHHPPLQYNPSQHPSHESLLLHHHLNPRQANSCGKPH
jgi:hypothetical protein